MATRLLDETNEPSRATAWDSLVDTIIDDRKSLNEVLFQATIESLIRPPARGKRKTLLRLTLQVADHNAYHIGQLVLMRRLLGNWSGGKSPQSFRG